MSIFSNGIDSVRKYLRISSIEADLKVLEIDVKTLDEARVVADINYAKIQAAEHNERLKICCMLDELQNSIRLSNIRVDDESRRREDAEKQLAVAVAILTNKVNNIERLVEQRDEATGDRKEQ